MFTRYNRDLFPNSVTVLILNWNGKELLETFLPSVVEYTPSGFAKVVVADNGSTDGSIEMLKAKFPSVGIIAFEKNLGFAEGYNQAMKQVHTPFSVLLNNDVEVTPGWLDEPIDLLDSSIEIACVQPKIRSYHVRFKYEYAGAAGGFLDRYGYPFCRGRIFDTVENDFGQYDRPIDLLWASGACMYVRTDTFKKEEGFDANFFAHQEEIDFCWRLKARGYRIVFCYKAHVFHKGGATLDTANPNKTFLNFRNNLLMIYKNMPKRRLRSVLFARYFLDRLAALRAYFTGNKDDARAILRAHREFRKLKRTYRYTRFSNMRETKLASIPEIMNKSLLWAYYVKKRRTFPKLQFIKEVYMALPTEDSDMRDYFDLDY
ncbi:MAG: glycosyltransferase family 2 protein [Tannerellaceae bacterium]|jgi:GT2 family glycosyltransferase|nr:glycosyltransferase family 2 protein [Tannerellaceae bacterium]